MYKRLSARLAAEVSIKNDRFLQSIFTWILGASMIWQKRTLWKCSEWIDFKFSEKACWKDFWLQLKNNLWKNETFGFCNTKSAEFSVVASSVKD